MTLVTVSGLGTLGLVRAPYEQDQPPEAWSRVKNVRFTEQGATAFPGHTEVFSAASIVPTWLKQFPPLSNPKWVYGNNTEMWVYESGTHTEITNVGGDYIGVSSERWHGDVFNGLGVFNNSQDPPQLWSPMNAATPLVDLPNWPANYLCKFLRPFKNFLIAGNIFDGSAQRPYRLKWSHPAVPGAVPSSWDHTDDALDAGERDLALTPDFLVDGLTLGEIFIVYREETTWGMEYIGFPDIFRTWQITEESGILTRDCAMELPLGHVVATRDDFLIHQGSGPTFRSLLEKQIRKWAFRQVDGSNYFNSFLVKNPSLKEVWWCFPEAGHIYANLAIVWSWTGGGIGIRELPNTPFAFGGPIGPTGISDQWG